MNANSENKKKRTLWYVSIGEEWVLSKWGGY